MLKSFTLSWLGLVSGASLAITSNSWFGIWCGLELNMISFIICAAQTHHLASAEALLKYFLSQVTGSFILLTTMIFHQELSNLSYLLATLSLSLKLGAAPLHFWFPQIAEGLEWIPLTTLMTIQKLAPLTLLSYITCPATSSLIIVISSISGIVGALGGLNEISIRKLLSFSSINHLGWMFLALIFKSPFVWLFYLTVYSVLLFSISVIFYSSQAYLISHLLPNKLLPQTQLSIVISFLSLAGLPPFLGFFPKWLIIIKSMELGIFFPVAFLVACSSMALFYYLRLSTNMIYLKLPSISSWMKLRNMHLSSFFSLNMLGTFIIFLLWSQELLQ